ncbi:MAG: serine hydrolase domain-containing protein [Alphaproteobacteria bacterium]
MPGAPVTFGEHPEVRAAFDLARAWIEARLAHLDIPAVAVAVVRDQEILWAEGFGAADRERGIRAGPQTLFPIASVTKLFTATAIMQLRDAGALGLDDPLARHLPWLRLGGGEAAITVRHLLTHTSGLAREAPFPYWSDFAFPGTGALRAALSDRQCVLPPATRWKYSNLGMTLAGEVVAAASGVGWADHVRGRVLEPLGMASTRTEPNPEDRSASRGYGRKLPRSERAMRPHSDLAGLAAAGGIASSVADLAKFMMLQFRDGPAGGSQVLAGATLAEMRRVHWLDPDWRGGWGLGFRVWPEDGRTVAGHFGLMAGFASDLRLLPEMKLGVVVLTNAEDGQPGIFAQRILQWTAAAVTRATPTTVAAVVDPGWSRYVGRYRDSWTDLEVLVDAAGLCIVPPHWIDPAAGMVRLVPVGPHAFRMSAGGFDYTDEVLTFELSEDGRASAVRIGLNPLHRVESW